MREILYTSLLLLIMFRFTYGEVKIYSTIKKSQNIMNMICLQNFILIFMSLLTALVVKNSHILAGIYLIILEDVLDKS